MTLHRGDIVLVDFPFSAGGGSKVRPAVVIQNNRDNQRLSNVIIVMITSHTGRAAIEATQVLIDISTPEGKQTGLVMNSAVNGVNLFTVQQQKVIHVIGKCSVSLQAGIDTALKAALELK